MMKRICTAVAACLLLVIAAGAFEVEGAGVHSATVYTAHYNNIPEAQAQMLKTLGLFQGSEQGFDLERGMTRAEAAAMLVRFLGKEQAALSGAYTHPFRDVPAWADGYVGYLHAQGLTKGTGSNTYGADEIVTHTQYQTFLSRAIEGTDDRVLLEYKEREAFDTGYPFLRKDAVHLSLRALEQTVGEEAFTLAQSLIRQGMFTEQAFIDAAWNVLPPDYHNGGAGEVICSIAGVEAARSEVTDVELESDVLRSDLPYLLAYTKTEESIAYYKLDPKTLAVEAWGTLLMEDGANRIDYIAGIGDAHYYAVYGAWEEWDFPVITALFRVSAAGAEPLLSVGTQEVPQSLTYRFVNQPNDDDIKDMLLVQNGDTAYVFSSDTSLPENFSVPEGSEVLFVSQTATVLQQVNAQETVISYMRLADGEILDTYAVPQFESEWEEWRELTTVSRDRNGQTVFFGEAGYYQLAFDGALQREVLQQLTAKPVLDTSAYRWGAVPSPSVILTHDLSHRSYHGTQVYLLADGKEIPQLINDPAHGIRITSIQCWDSVLFLTSAVEVGMGRENIYEYSVMQNDTQQPFICVQDFTAGYPEVETGHTWENPDGYKAPGIEREQQRLNALGFGTGES